MKKLDVEEYLQAIDTFLGRYTNCRLSDREQGYEQISLDDYMQDCQWQ